MQFYLIGCKKNEAKRFLSRILYKGLKFNGLSKDNIYGNILRVRLSINKKLHLI